MSARIADANGWIEIEKQPLSLVGVFPYRGATVDATLPPDEVVQVYRPAEELSRDETIASMRLLPWVAGHTMLGDEFGVAAEDKGVGGVIGEKIVFEGDTLYGNIKLFSKEQEKLINDAGVVDLSIGYTCTWEKSEGVYNGMPYQYIQRDIIGNHLASVPDGRMGKRVSVLDQQDSTGMKYSEMTIDQLNTLVKSAQAEKARRAAKDEDDTVKVTEDEEEVKAEVKDEETVKVTEDEEEITTKVEDDDIKEVTSTEKAVAAAEGINLDSLSLEQLNALAAQISAKLKGTVQDAQDAVIAAIGRRDNLAGRVKQVVGVFDHSEMTEKQVIAYAAKKIGIKATADSVNGYLAAVNKRAATSRTVAQDSAVTSTPAFLASHLDA